jgi:hypothetical protein
MYHVSTSCTPGFAGIIRDHTIFLTGRQQPILLEHSRGVSLLLGSFANGPFVAADVIS